MTKMSPQSRRLERVLRSSKIVAGGFMGADTRAVEEVIDADLVELAKLGTTAAEIAAKMRQITDDAKTGLGAWIALDRR